MYTEAYKKLERSLTDNIAEAQAKLPDFKFRTCLYAHCPYKKQVNVFRSTPEKWDILYARKKADKNRRP